MLLPDGRKSLEPWLKDEVQFYPHQVQGVRTLTNKKSWILGDEMGVGKSIQALGIFCIDIIRGMAETCIIVCPLSLKENWADEIEKFTRVPYHVLESKGGAVARAREIAKFKAGSGPRILIVNYEQVRSNLSDLNKHPAGRNFAWDVAIYDEAHTIKNPNSKRTKATLALNSLRNFMLTGTPILNNVNELWALLNKIDPLKWPNYWRYVNRFCVFGGYQNRQIIGVKNEKELQEILTEFMLRRLAKDVLDLKDPVPVTRYVTLLPEQRELYDQAKNELVLIDPETGLEQDIDNALTKFLRLKQICGSTYSFTGEDHSAKFDRAMVDNMQIFSQGDKAIVFSQFIDVQNTYRARLEAKGIPTWLVNGSIKPKDRLGLVKEWSSDPRPGVIICGLQVAGIGLNMTAAHYVQFLDKLYVPGLNKQAIARANRIGQDKNKAVIVVYYLAKDTIESRIEAILNTKQNTFDTVIEMDFSWKRDFLKTLRENV